MEVWKTDPANEHARRYVDLLVRNLEAKAADRDVSLFRGMRAGWRVADVPFKGVPEDILSATDLDFSTACVHAQNGEWSNAQGVLDQIRARW